jgi:hypothetical protein
MKASQWFNAITVIFTGSLALTLLVVCVMFVVNLDTGPRIRDEFAVVLPVTIVFTVLTALSGAAFFAQRRSWPRRDWLQLALYVAVVAGSWYLYKVMI